MQRLREHPKRIFFSLSKGVVGEWVLAVAFSFLNASLSILENFEVGNSKDDGSLNNWGAVGSGGIVGT